MDLHYVGISTEQDSYQRLLANAHHKRVAILSNETQYIADARLTNEIYLFFVGACLQRGVARNRGSITLGNGMAPRSN
jgi:hypothetical protein